MIDTKGLDKGMVLAALYNNARPQGMGLLHYDPKPMELPEANAILAADPKRPYFDYLKGRVMKIDLTHDDEFDGWLYDRDNGPGAAARAIDTIRKHT